ncbi:copper chaperone NosL [Duganella sp. CF458]|uniref:nitrous oxide reductase accessory protein NosL n=1 Tax=Duganella sp. CF458 TaxID=1884368 RepID=UPI0008EB1013|nr:nitrous oxide reductase accessory protein NosL [Duganella sp. CF458]SFF52673.1 copper chaperone NosL [Duganella sp. CF458]
MSVKRNASVIVVLLLLAACGDAPRSPTAGEPADDAVCALDGMSLKDYPGPKAQIVFMDGRIDYFCSLAELFEVLFGEEGQRGIGASYVQDMGKAAWDKPRGHWIEARNASYVIDSRAQGAMGPTVATFASKEDAQTFAKREGGRVLDYSQVRPDVLKLGTRPAHEAHDDSMR